MCMGFSTQKVYAYKEKKSKAPLIILIVAGLLLIGAGFCFSDHRANREAVQFIRPGAVFTMHGETYEGIVWQDKSQKKPTKTEFNNALTSYAKTKKDKETEEKLIQETLREMALEKIKQKKGL